MEINKPTKTTYFICRNEAMEVKAYGQVDPNEVMTTGQPNVVTYLNESEWSNKLKSEGITIEVL